MTRALGSRYQLGESLGSGAMGRVFIGVDNDGREFAFKILRGDLTGNPDAVARFLQERSILVSLRHPNLVGVHDLVVEGETVAIVMDLVRGGDLRGRLREEGTLLPSEVARVGASVAWALAAVHAAQVVHRDVKPENILMDGSTPRLSDFGIASLASSSEVGRSSLLAGTPQYVAPELAEGADPTPAADLYSLGIVLYELCCGVTPFAGKSMLAVIRQHAEQEPGRPQGIPDQLWELISWLLQKTPRARPQSAQQVATLLDAMVTELIQFPVAPKLDAPPAAQPIQHAATTQFGIPNVGPTPLPAIAGVAPPVRRGRRKVLVFTTLALLLVGTGSAYAMLRPSSGTDGAATVPAPAATTAEQVGPVESTSTATASTTTRVTELTVAPNLVGKKLADAQDALPSSLDVQVVDSIQQGAQPGTVVAQDPKPNEPLNGKITLTVAREAVQAYLDEFRAVSGDWQGTASQVAGKTYLHSLSGYAGCYGDTKQVEYIISKGYRRLVATAGMDDNAQNPDLKVQLEIFGDGRKLLSSTIDYGKAVPVDIDVSGVLRLKIQWTAAQKSCSGDNYIVLGEVSLFGLPGEVPTSGVSSTTTTTR